MKIGIRMNLKARKVVLKTKRDTPNISNLRKCSDFLHAFMLGFDVIDAIALLDLDELYVESFEIKILRHFVPSWGSLVSRCWKIVLENLVKPNLQLTMRFQDKNCDC
jgi:hypothetical protein